MVLTSSKVLQSAVLCLSSGVLYREMASLGRPLHTYRSLLRELRQNCGVDRYRKTIACGFIREQFRRNQVGQKIGIDYTILSDIQDTNEQHSNSLDSIYLITVNGFVAVTSEKLCLAHQELHFQASTYLCLLQSVRNHLIFHEEYHGKGERSVEEVAGLVGLKVPQQPGGKGWEG